MGLLLVKKPCNECLVKACCSEPCKNYAIFVYESKQYEQAGDMVKENINDMPYEKAIDHILKVETIYFHIRHIGI